MTASLGPNVVVCYSHLDRKLFSELRTAMTPILRKGCISEWDDTCIAAGAKWRDEIRMAIDSADVAVLLVSPDFLASDFIAKEELPPLLAAAAKKKTTVLPVYISACLWDETPIAEYQAVISSSRPLDQYSLPRRRGMLVQIVKTILAAASRRR